jgi:UDP-glucuronate decarboxylase
MMKLLIAGGAGFLGSHLCDRLVAEGNHVICVDNFETGSLKNIRHLLSNKNFELVNHDVSVALEIKHLDGIYNFACPASPVSYQRDPIQTLKTSVIGALNLLNLANQTNSRILQASTSEVYGDPLIHPQNEKYWGNVNPIGIRACYDEGKRAAETLFIDSYRTNRTDIRVARIFNTYGSRMSIDDGRVISNFIVQALQNKPLTVHGDGSQSRSFCFVNDLVEGVVKLFNVDNLHSPVNLGNPSSTSVISLAREIIDLTQSRSKILFVELPSDDPKRREPDITEAKRNLAWEPVVSRQDGLIATIKYFRELLN